MIHLSRFLIGIRHSRSFSIQSVSGRIIDDCIKIFPNDFKRVDVTPANNQIVLQDDDISLIGSINIDDIIIDGRKLYDPDKKCYVEINKRRIIDVAEKCLPIVTKRLELDKDYSRIGIIFEFRIPNLSGKQDDLFAKFILDNFINFQIDAEGSEANIRFVYRLPVAGALAIAGLEGNYYNIIILLNQSAGIDEDGKDKPCLLASIDIQRLFKPNQKTINVSEHYDFCDKLLRNKILPAFKTKGIDINL